MEGRTYLLSLDQPRSFVVAQTSRFHKLPCSSTPQKEQERSSIINIAQSYIFSGNSTQIIHPLYTIHYKIYLQSRQSHAVRIPQGRCRRWRQPEW